ncbi:MAG: hypothetical protein ABIH28_04205 [archaeon]
MNGQEIITYKATWFGIILLIVIIIVLIFFYYIQIRNKGRKDIQIRNKRIMGGLLRDIGLTSLVGFLIGGTITEIKTFWILIPLSIVALILGEVIKSKNITILKRKNER